MYYWKILKEYSDEFDSKKIKVSTSQKLVQKNQRLVPFQKILTYLTKNSKIWKLKKISAETQKKNNLRNSIKEKVLKWDWLRRMKEQ